ncbi:MAG: hypothetical protein Q4C12_08640, partial [Clostridia bacterium]|nr:hypothetical protein [Clostridia bacterium]
MPNHVENYISLKGDERQITAMLEAIKSDEYGIGTIDFNKIIPMPESLNIEAGSRTDKGLESYRDFVDVYTLGGTINMDKLGEIPKKSEEIFLSQRTDIKPDEWELGKTAWQNIQKYGAPTWYDWSIANWGTKWNAYGYDSGRDYSGGDSLWFQTAWSAPHPILEKLTELYPDITMEHQWADEDLGVNCGRFSYKGGERIEEYLPENDVEALEYAASVWEYDLAELGYVMNKTGSRYIYNESQDFEKIELFGKPTLFTNDRLTDADIPEDLYCYHLRHSDDGDRFCSVEPRVAVNHGGSIVMKEPLDFGKDGYISFSEDTEPN